MPSLHASGLGTDFDAFAKSPQVIGQRHPALVNHTRAV